eukprot:GHVP01026310.1.p1 GENE.GHVP01026310.1~~GHVP01026310.1.p1  ORF type:complete len:626 (+),score=96.65 GHVP01026310.1:177-2054(+)
MKNADQASSEYDVAVEQHSYQKAALSLSRAFRFAGQISRMHKTTTSYFADANQQSIHQDSMIIDESEVSPQLTDTSLLDIISQSIGLKRGRLIATVSNAIEDLCKVELNSVSVSRSCGDYELDDIIEAVRLSNIVLQTCRSIVARIMSNIISKIWNASMSGIIAEVKEVPVLLADHDRTTVAQWCCQYTTSSSEQSYRTQFFEVIKSLVYFLEAHFFLSPDTSIDPFIEEDNRIETLDLCTEFKKQFWSAIKLKIQNNGLKLSLQEKQALESLAISCHSKTQKQPNSTEVNPDLPEEERTFLDRLCPQTYSMYQCQALDQCRKLLLACREEEIVDSHSSNFSIPSLFVVQDQPNNEGVAVEEQKFKNLREIIANYSSAHCEILTPLPIDEFTLIQIGVPKCKISRGMQNCIENLAQFLRKHPKGKQETRIVNALLTLTALIRFQSKKKQSLKARLLAISDGIFAIFVALALPFEFPNMTKSFGNSALSLRAAIQNSVDEIIKEHVAREVTFDRLLEVHETFKQTLPSHLASSMSAVLTDHILSKQIGELSLSMKGSDHHVGDRIDKICETYLRLPAEIRHKATLGSALGALKKIVEECSEDKEILSKLIENSKTWSVQYRKIVTF